MYGIAASAVLAWALLFLAPTTAWSGELTGLWQEYDDKSGKVEALIRIEQAPDGTYQGKIEKLFPEVVPMPSACTRCAGSLRGQPLLGLRILSGMTRNDALNFDGGAIVDPEDGKVYHCHIRLSEDGNSLEVTGYVGVKWLGQSETWRRAR